MNPVPLADPSGRLRAWMCGCCNHVGYGSEAMYRNADEHTLTSSKARANACCTCTECGGPNPRGGRTSALRCETCCAKERERAEAELAERLKTHAQCEECDGSGDVWSDKYREAVDCAACNGSGWVEREPTNSTPVACADVNAQSTSELEREG